MSEVLFFVAAFVAEVLGTIVGFGSSTIFLPLALFFVDFKTALILVAIFHISGNIGRISFFRKGIDKKILLRFGIPSVVLAVVGAFLVNYMPQNMLKLIFGAFLLLFSIFSFVKPEVKPPAKKGTLVLGGALSGFFAGLIGTGGVLRGAFLTAFRLKKMAYIGTSAAIALATDATRIPIYVASGFLESKYYYYIPLLFVIAIAGSYIGKRVVDKIPQEIFRKLVLLAIALLSLKFIFDGLSSL